MRKMNISTLIYTKLFGTLVGEDNIGNRYYESKRMRWFSRKNRWIVYSSKSYMIANVSSVWFNWLHYRTNFPPNHYKAGAYSWEINTGITNYKIQTCDKTQYEYDGWYSSWKYDK